MSDQKPFTTLFSQPASAESKGETVQAEMLEEVRLSGVRGVGPLLRKRLVEGIGSATAVLRANDSELARVQGVGAATIRAIRKAPTAEAAAAMLQEAARRGILPICIDSPEYPPALREIYDPPPILYCRGTIDPTDQMAIAIVGTRRATRYGIRQAEALATGLAQAGITVVSGLARGIDGVVHRATLAAGGRTLAVMAGGLMKIYPPEHARLADEIAANGALLAEPAPNVAPITGSFPQRNRIISGLSLGVVVVEAAERSGALITARHAAEQGRDAFAVPGPVDSPQSIGCCRLLQEGAKLVVSVDDILEEIESQRMLGATDLPTSRFEKPKSSAKGSRQTQKTFSPESTASTSQPNVSRVMSEDEQLLWKAIDRKSISIDALVEITGLAVPRVLVAISLLETAGDIRRVSGALVQRA